MTDGLEQKKVIAFTGRIACGKGIAGSLLTRLFSAFKIDYSDSLHEALHIMGIVETRDSIQKLSTFLRSHFGNDSFQRAVLKKIKATESSVISLIGVRRLSDFEKIKQEYSFRLIYIESNFEGRFKRYSIRNKCEGDGDLDRNDFREKDNKEPELQIESLKSEADIVIENNGTLEEFQSKLEVIFKKILS